MLSTLTTQIGVGRATISTEKPVIVNENLPRILRTGDLMTLAPVVFNRTGKKQKFTVEIVATGVEVQDAKQDITLDNDKSATVLFVAKNAKIPASDSIGQAKITITATAQESGEYDSVEKVLPVTRSETWESVATIGTVQDTMVDQVIQLGGIDKTRSVFELKTSPTLFGKVLEGTKSTTTYSYDATERIA